MSGLLGVPVDAAYHLVFALTHLLTPVAGGLAAAAAIVLFTAAVRLLISPLSFRALRGQAAMARLTPQVQALRTRHRRQPERLQRELTALYKREGTGPFSSVLPLLAQWPFLSVMYLLFRSATVNGTQNQLLSDGLFGVPLGTHWLSGGGLLSVHDMLFLAVLAVLAALCWLSARLAKRAVPAPASPAPAVSGVGTAAAHRVDRVPASAARAGQSGKGAARSRTGTGQPSKEAGQPRTEAGQPRKETAQPRRGTGQPGKGTAQPRTEAGQPRKETAQPRRGTGQPGKGTAQPRRGTGQPGKEAAQPRTEAGQPRAGTGPSSAAARPDPAEALANSKAAGLLTRVLPYLTVVIAAFAPLAAVIYLLTTVAWTSAERRLFLRRTLSPGSTTDSSDTTGSTGSPGSTGRAASVPAEQTR
jgi:YidC/Oxa1 family membrane protein insertase